MSNPNLPSKEEYEKGVKDAEEQLLEALRETFRLKPTKTTEDVDKSLVELCSKYLEFNILFGLGNGQPKGIMHHDFGYETKGHSDE